MVRVRLTLIVSVHESAELHVCNMIWVSLFSVSTHKESGRHSFGTSNVATVTVISSKSNSSSIGILTLTEIAIV